MFKFMLRRAVYEGVRKSAEKTPWLSIVGVLWFAICLVLIMKYFVYAI